MDSLVNNPGKESGITLLEMLIAISIMALILSVGMPSMANIVDSQRILGAAEQVYGHIQQARSVSVSSNSPVYLNFDVDDPGTTDWSYGMSTANSLCDLSVVDPTTANACVLVLDDGDGNIDPGDGSVDTDDLILNRFTNNDFDTIAVGVNTFSSGNSQIEFDPVRGTATSGAINLVSAEGRQVRVTINLLGRVGICSPDGSVPNYKEC